MDCVSLLPVTHQNAITHIGTQQIPTISDQFLHSVQIIQRINNHVYIAIHDNTVLYTWMHNNLSREAVEQAALQQHANGNLLGAWYRNTISLFLLSRMPVDMPTSILPSQPTILPSSPILPTILPSSPILPTILPSSPPRPSILPSISMSPPRPEILPPQTSVLQIQRPNSPSVLQPAQSKTSVVLPTVISGAEIVCNDVVPSGNPIPLGAIKLGPAPIRFTRGTDSWVMKFTETLFSGGGVTIFKVKANDYSTLMQVTKDRVDKAACIQNMISKSEYGLAFSPLCYWPSKNGGTGGAILSMYNGEQTLFDWLRGTTRDIRTADVLSAVIIAVCNLNINMEIAHHHIHPKLIFLSRTPSTTTDVTPIYVKIMEFSQATQNTDMMAVDYPKLLTLMKAAVGEEGQSVIHKMLACLPSELGGSVNGITNQIKEKLATCIPKKTIARKSKAVSVGGGVEVVRKPRAQSTKSTRALGTPKQPKKARKAKNRKNTLCEVTSTEFTCGEGMPDYANRMTQNEIDKIVIADVPFSDDNGIKKYTGTTKDESEVMVSIGDVSAEIVCLQNAMNRSGHALDVLAHWQCENRDRVRITRVAGGIYSKMTLFTSYKRNEWIFKEMIINTAHTVIYMNLKYGASRKIDLDELIVSTAGSVLIRDYDVPFTRSDGLSSMESDYTHLMGQLRKLLAKYIENAELTFAGDARRILTTIPSKIAKVYADEEDKSPENITRLFKDYIERNYHYKPYKASELFTIKHNIKDNIPGYEKSLSVNVDKLTIVHAKHALNTNPNVYTGTLIANDRKMPVLLYIESFDHPATVADLKRILKEPEGNIDIIDYWRDGESIYVVYRAGSEDDDDDDDTKRPSKKKTSSSKKASKQKNDEESDGSEGSDDDESGESDEGSYDSDDDDESEESDESDEDDESEESDDSD